jgi:phosphomannomutase/phosphoglucomutase
VGRLFGTNGVRGVVNAELTVEMVTRLAASAAEVLREELAIGRDGRTTSPMLRDAAVAGLLSQGCTVHDLGVLPTPALQYAVKTLRLDGGIIVTASHNPPEFNGVKTVAADGVETSRETEDRIEEIFFAGGPEPAPWDRVGKVIEGDALGPYMDAVVKQVDAGVVKAAQLSVAIDPGSGVAALTAPEIARRLGCRVFTINAEIDGTFPGRNSEPRPDNLSGLSELVRASGADLGIAFDGDGDRSIFADERGAVYYGDRSLALLAKAYVETHPGAEVVTSVSSSRAVQDVVEAAGGRVIWTPVGSVVISRAMVGGGVMFGGEENGGIMYGPHQAVRDGSMIMALVLELMARTGKPLSRLFAELPQYAQAKDRVICTNELKERTLEALKNRVEAPKIETIDGLKLCYEDGAWILFRPSGTEPVFRLYAEAATQERAQELVDENKRLIEETVSSLR